MPQFILNGRDHAARAESAFVLGFIEAMFFTETSPAFDSEDWFTDECKEAREQGRADGELPGDVGYTDLHPDALAAIRADCEAWQEANAELLERAYNAHWQAAALAEGFSRVPHSGLFNAPLGHGWRIADFESWQELCETERIEPGPAYDETQAGRDYWFTRNGHGVGFWDREQLRVDDIGAQLTKASEYKEAHPFFGNHVTHGDKPFVHIDGLKG